MSLNAEIKAFVINWIQNGLADNMEYSNLVVASDYSDINPDIVVSVKNNGSINRGLGTYLEYNEITEDAVRVFIYIKTIIVKCYSLNQEELNDIADVIQEILTDSKYIPRIFNKIREYNFKVIGIGNIVENDETMIDKTEPKKWTKALTFQMQVAKIVVQEGIYNIVTNNKHIPIEKSLTNN